MFLPDVIWATFGNTDSWVLAQKLSRLSNCPWVADFKDNWGAFLPYGLKALMANRFRDAAHMTVLSETQLHDANRWFRGQKTVLYSGVEPVSQPSLSSGFRILLTGSIYNTEHLVELVMGLRNWLESITDGIGDLKKTLQNISHYRNVAWFLFARMMYTDGLNTLFAFYLGMVTNP